MIFYYLFIIIEIVKIKMMRPPEKINASNEASVPDSVKGVSHKFTVLYVFEASI